MGKQSGFSTEFSVSGFSMAAAAAAVRVARGMSNVGDTSDVDAPDPEDVANLTALLRSAEVEPGDDTESMREYAARNLELERLAEHLEAEASSLTPRDAPRATDNTENLFAKAFWFDMSALTPRCAQEHADALQYADAFLEDVTLIQDVLPALDEYCQYLGTRYYNQVQCELLLILAMRARCP